MKNTFTRREVERIADKAFWKGVGQGGIDYAGENWSAQEFVGREES